MHGVSGRTRLPGATETAGRPRGRSLEGEPGVLGQDGRLQPLQLGPGLNAELLTEHPTGVLERTESVGLASGAVEGEHEHAPEPLPERMGGDHGPELVEAVHVAAEGEVGFDPILGRAPAELAQPGALGRGEVVEDEVGEGVPPPQRQRLSQQVRCSARHPLRRLGATFAHQTGEPQGVDVVGVQVEHVAGRVSDEHVGGAGLPQRPPSLRDDKVEGVGRLLRQLVAVEAFDEPVGAHDVAGVERQDRSQRPQLLAAEADRRAVVRRHLQRAEKPDLHEAEGTTPTPPSGCRRRRRGWIGQTETGTRSCSSDRRGVVPVPSRSSLGSTRSSERGSHQLALPRRLIVDGTSTIRTKVASRKTAVARPTPNIFSMTSALLTKATKMLIMMRAAEVITRAVDRRPSTTLVWLSPVRTYSSLIRLSRNTS